MTKQFLPIFVKNILLLLPSNNLFFCQALNFKTFLVLLWIIVEHIFLFDLFWTWHSLILTFNWIHHLFSLLIYLLFVLCWIHQLIWLIQFTYFVIILLNLSSFWINFIALQFKHCCQSALILYYLLIDFVLINLFSWALCYKLRFDLFIASSKTLSSFSTVVLIENRFSFGLFNIVMICHSITFVIEKYYLCWIMTYEQCCCFD